MGQMHRGNRLEMKLFSFSFFLLLVQTFQGIEGDVVCGKNNREPSCRTCLLSPEGPLQAPRIDLENCNTSPDCMLNENSTNCVTRSENLLFSPTNANNSNTNNTSSESNLATSSPREIFISMIKVNMRQKRARPIRQFGLQVQVCNERRCCPSHTVNTDVRTRSTISFASAIGNLGACETLPFNQTVGVMVYMTTHEEPQEKFDLLSVTVSFDDGSVFKKEASYWSLKKLEWGHFYQKRIVTRGNRREEAIPVAHCPANNANACPRRNVRVHGRKDHRERKYCYYQNCETFSADLSTLANGHEGLGTGGYCMPMPEPEAQYIFCCDLESYFTYPTLDPYGQYVKKDPEDIKFPRCSHMIPHPIPN